MGMTEHRCGTWVEHFPGNLRWSNAMQIVKGMVPWAASAMAEIDIIGARLKAREHEADLDRAWSEEWSRMAERLEKIAGESHAKGRKVTAGDFFMRAGNYYYSAERFLVPGEEKTAMYRKALRCYHGALDRLYPQIEHIDVPCDGKPLAAYYLPAPGAGRKPTVVLFDGMDNCKEMSVIFAGLEFAKRSINTLAIDGPGQGESLRLRGIHARPDYEVAGRAAFDHVVARADVDPKRIVVMGYSFGGYHATRIAGLDKRYAGAVALGATRWDIYQRTVDAYEKLKTQNPRTSSTSTFQWRWVVGAKDNDEALEIAKRYTLDGIADKVECPFLILHGQDDRLTPVSAAETLYQRLGTKKKELRVFTADEGGAEHCQVDHRQVATGYIGDWINENVK
jgi:alpha-beta hydrolase superfamily lysophospholipase